METNFFFFFFFLGKIETNRDDQENLKYCNDISRQFFFIFSYNICIKNTYNTHTHARIYIHKQELEHEV